MLMERTYIDIHDVCPNTGQIQGLPKNPRSIDKARFRQLVKSIQELPEMTEARDLLVARHDGKYVVLGGNMRLKAYKSLGWEKVPCCVLPDGLPPEKLREIVIQDNNPFGDTDWDLIAEEWDMEELRDWGLVFPKGWNPSGIPTAEEDDFSEKDEENAKSRVASGDLWELGSHRLYCGDSTDAKSLQMALGGALADLLVTDPPYNVDYTGGTKDLLKIKNDKMSDNDFAKFLSSAMSCAYASIKDGASAYVWHADLKGAEFRRAFTESGLELKQCLIWKKNSMVMGRQDYQWKHEPCLYGWKPGAAHKWYSDRKQTTILEFDRPQRNDMHPTMKPVKLIAYLIGNSTAPGDLVLDTFGGSGTTLIACEQLGRRCAMVELDPHYCDVIIARWEKLTGGKATLKLGENKL